MGLIKWKGVEWDRWGLHWVELGFFGVELICFAAAAARWEKDRLHNSLVDGDWRLALDAAAAARWEEDGMRNLLLGGDGMLALRAAAAAAAAPGGEVQMHNSLVDGSGWHWCWPDDCVAHWQWDMTHNSLVEDKLHNLLVAGGGSRWSRDIALGLC